VALIDAAFEKQIAIVEKGELRRVSVFEAILLQLLTKEISGDKPRHSCPIKISGIRCSAEWLKKDYHRTRVPGGSPQTRTTK
jgi:hypothetical protein